MATKFGTLMRQARWDRNVAGHELAKAIGMARGHICQVETGARTPSLETALSIAAALDIEPAKALEAIEADRPRSFRLSEWFLRCAEESRQARQACEPAGDAAEGVDSAATGAADGESER